MDQQQRYGHGRDVMGAADLQDVPQAHDGWIPRRDVPQTHVVIHAQVEDNVDLRQVGVARDVKLTFRRMEKKCRRSSVWWCQRTALRQITVIYRYLVRCWIDFFPPLCSYRHPRSVESLQGQFKKMVAPKFEGNFIIFLCTNCPIELLDVHNQEMKTRQHRRRCFPGYLTPLSSSQRDLLLLCVYFWSQ